MNPSTSTKIVILLVMLLLIGAPLISYFYLKGGYNYRVNLLEELKDKGQVSPFNFVMDSAMALKSEDLKGQVTLISYVIGEQAEFDYLSKLQDQFQGREEFQMWSFVNRDHPGPVPDNWKVISTTGKIIAHFLSTAISDSLGDEPPLHVLIDTSGSVRHYYQGGDVNVQQKMVEHITVILPRSEESDIIYQPTANGK